MMGVDRDMGDEMLALNRAFEKAFASNDDNDSVVELLACMGEELGCDRISILRRIWKASVTTPTNGVPPE